MHDIHMNMRWRAADFECVRAEAKRMGVTVSALIRQGTLDLVHRRAAEREALRHQRPGALCGWAA